MNEEENPQRDSKPQPQAQPETTPMEPNASVPSKDAGWAGASPTQVMRTVAIALLTTAVVLGAFFLLWKVRTFVGWFVISLFLAAVLNPAVNWLERRFRFMKRPLAIGLTYLGVLVALLLVVGIFVPVLTDQINGFIKFATTAANAPEGPAKYIEGLAKQNGLGGFMQRFEDQLDELRKQLGGVLQNLLSASGQIAISVAGAVAALATVLTLTFFLLLGSERYVNAGVGLFPRGTPASRATPLLPVCGGDQRLYHGQPRHQRDLRYHHLHRAAATRHALRRPAGTPGCCSGPYTAGWRDAGWGATGRSGTVRRAVEGCGATGLYRGLPAGRRQRAATPGLQQSCPAQRAGDPDSTAGGRAATRHPRCVAGHPCGRDHPHRGDRATGLPAHAERGEGARRCLLVAACYF